MVTLRHTIPCTASCKKFSAMASLIWLNIQYACRKVPPSPYHHDQDSGARQFPSMSPAGKQLHAAGTRSVLDKAKLWDLRASQQKHLPTLEASLRKPTKDNTNP